VYAGTKADREALRLFEFHYWDSSGAEIKGIRYKFDVLVASYEIILSDASILSQILWQVLVMDEAHRVKNWKSKLNLTIRKTFKYHRCLLLTGTPIQNTLDELWVLLHISSPAHFPEHEQTKFLREYGNSQDLTSDSVVRLQKKLQEFLLRRVKEDVAAGKIPPKEETVIECELTSLQKQYYRAILERNKSFLYSGCDTRNLPNLINLSMQLRKICNHPYLIEGVENKLIMEKSSGDSSEITERFLLDLVIQSSGKMVLVDKLLHKLLAGGHKVLIFSQLKMMLNVVEYYLKLKGLSFERIDGDTPSKQRQEAIDRFSSPDSPSFIFLLCTRAGGAGINLAAADTVIIYDSDFNPQNDVWFLVKIV
jgi:SNF2 family DNA or RNA helicase